MFNRKSKRRIISMLLAMMMIFTMVPGVAFAGTGSSADGLYIYIDGKDVTNQQVTCYYGVETAFAVKQVKDGVTTDVPLADVTVEQSVATATISDGTMIINQVSQLGKTSDFTVTYGDETAKTMVYTGVLIEAFTKDSNPVDALEVNSGTDLKFNMSYVGGNNKDLGQYIKANYKVEVKAGDEDRSEYFTKFAAGASSGKITITVKATKAEDVVFYLTLDGKTLACNIKVKVDRIQLSKNIIAIDPEETATLEYEVAENLNSDDIVWTSSNDEVVTVENGKVTGVKQGQATVSATIDGKTVTCKVTVLADGAYGLTGAYKNYAGEINKVIDQLIGPYDNGVTLNGPESSTEYIMLFENGQKKQLAIGYQWVYASSDTSVVKDNGDGAGRFVPVANGEAEICIYARNNNEGKKELLGVVPVTVTGMPTDAPDIKDQMSAVTEPQTANSSVMLTNYTVNNMTANGAFFENYIAELTPTNPQFKLTFTDCGKLNNGSVPEDFETTYADEISAYLDVLKTYIELTDADGNPVEIEVVIDDIYQNGNFMSTDVTVSAEGLNNSQAYKLTLKDLIPTITYNTNMKKVEYGSNNSVMKAVEYNFNTEEAVVPEEPTNPNEPTQPEDPTEQPTQPSEPGNDGAEGDKEEQPTQPEDDATADSEDEDTDVTTDDESDVAEDDEDADKEDKDSAAQTGDESNMAAMFALMMAALLTAGAAVIRRREN